MTTEKSLSLTISPNEPGKANVVPLCPAIEWADIVRKTLGGMKSLMMQTTAIDQTCRHRQSHPRCWRTPRVNGFRRIGQSARSARTATPHRMGAALTYARRDARFTPDGIAGEDDLDAPDLTTPTGRTPGPATPKAHGNGQSKGTQHRSGRQGRRDAADHRHATPNLATEASAQLRDRLLTEVHELGSSDDAATWAHGNTRRQEQAECV